MILLDHTRIGDAWIAAMLTVVTHGHFTQDNDETLMESDTVIVTIGAPTEHDALTQKHEDPAMIDWMRHNFLDTSPVDGWGYSYGSRLLNFQGHNQFEAVIEKLRRRPSSKSATLVFALPPEDRSHVPCITCFDLKYRDNQLNGTAFFRSQDAGKKFYADALCLGELLRQIAAALEMETGFLNLYIASLHIYEKDLPRVHAILDAER